MAVASAADLQKALGAQQAAPRTLACGEEHAATYLGMQALAGMAGRDPGGYHEGSWCSALRGVLKGPGEARGGPAGSVLLSV
jgi:hypothetical protein